MDTLYPYLLDVDIPFEGLEEEELSSDDDKVFSVLKTVPQPPKSTLEFSQSNANVPKQPTSTRHFEKGKKYEILECFFRLFLKRDNKKMVNKNAVYANQKKLKTERQVYPLFKED